MAEAASKPQVMVVRRIRVRAYSVRSGTEEPTLSFEALEMVTAPRLERKSRGALGEIACGARHEDLARSPSSDDAALSVHRRGRVTGTPLGCRSTLVVGLSALGDASPHGRTI